jgi:hypothetical protein
MSVTSRRRDNGNDVAGAVALRCKYGSLDNLSSQHTSPSITAQDEPTID